MRELKILVIVVIVIGVIYWGVEPLAHSIMHPKVAPAEFDFVASGKNDVFDLKQLVKKADANLKSAQKSGNQLNIERAQKELDKAQENLANLDGFWSKMDLKNGNAEEGKQIFVENCNSCHTVKSQPDLAARSTEQSDEEVSQAYGVIPPDLSTVAAVLDHNFLAHFIKNPILASKLWHKEDLVYPMSGYDWLGDEAIGNIVAYLSSIAPKEISDKEVFEQACLRCHSVNYDKLTSPSVIGDLNRYLGARSYIYFYMSSNSSTDDLERYLGARAPDLSMMIRARGEDYLYKFMNDPQKLLPGTSMPRLGLTKEAEEKVINYLNEVGDTKKEQRESLGWKIMLFFGIMAVLAYLWKRKIWAELH